MPNFSAPIKNLDRVIAIAEQFPAISEKYINAAIQKSLVRVLGQIKAPGGAPVGVNNVLRDQWLIETRRFYGRLYSTTPYALFVEMGTKPHQMPVASNPDFQKWAESKGLNPWAVAKSIAKKGTQANPFFERSIGLSLDGINTDFFEALKGITKELEVK